MSTSATTPGHMRYWIDCAEFERLVRRAEGRCERCGEPTRKLEIDHDHLIGRHAVRGLVCHRCNLIIGYVETGERPADPLTR